MSIKDSVTVYRLSTISLLVLTFSIFCLANLSVAHAHGDGASIEKVVNGYLIDIGYAPADLKTGEPARFDFLLYEAPAEGGITEANPSPVPFSSAFMRLERDGQLLFAGEIKKPEFGEAGLSYTFLTPGDYSGFVRYSDAGKTLVEDNFYFAVSPGEEDISSNTSVLTLLLAFVAGVLLTYLFYTSGDFWRSRADFPPPSFINRAWRLVRTDRRANVDSVANGKTFLLSNLLVQLVIALVFAVGAYYATSWYLSGEIKWPSLDLPTFSSDESEPNSPVATKIDGVEIVLTERGFQPSEITVKQGTTVSFSTTVDRPFWPASNLHPSHEIYSAFDPKRPIAANETWSFVFDQVGDWDMHDHIRSYFTGTIHVVP